MTLHATSVLVTISLAMSDTATKTDPYAPWRSRDYRCYEFAWFAMTFSKQIETLAVAVYFVSIYNRADAPLALGALGLVQALAAWNLEFDLRQAEAAGQREMVLAEMSLIILGRWPENVAVVLPEPAPDSASRAPQPSDKR